MILKHIDNNFYFLTAWVQRTGLSYWDGKEVKGNAVWALHVIG